MDSADPRLLPVEERALVLEEWNATAVPLPALPVHRQLEAQAARTPDAVAAAYQGRPLTFRELDARANQLAHHLIALGVGPEVLVGICVERSLEMVVGLLGILKAGGAYLPLDPSYPAERLAFVVEDARPRVILAGERLVDRLPAGGAPPLLLDAGWGAIAERPTTPPAAEARPDQLAYVIYTSGSTGRPKGVLLEHRGLANLVAAQIRAFAIGPESRVLQFAAFGFDASVSEVFTSLCAGAALHLEPRESLLPGAPLLAVLRDRGISVVTLPPSALAILPPDDLPSLRTVVAAGEACSAEIVARWAPGRRFVNAYGPTEITVCATWARCDPASGAPPIGRPLENTQLYVLDEQMAPLAIGEPGELYVGGVGVARGYLGRPELTAEKFVASPFGPGRLYRTGDRVRYRPDGNLEFLGRIDHQVKVRGYRIELGEIEETLRRHPKVADAAVVAREDAPGDQRLVAYVVARDLAAPATGSELRAFAARSLAEYMVPHAVVRLPSLPLTPHGKVDRKALPAPGAARPELPVPFVPPRDETERQLAALWEQALGVAPVGARDDFFDLGGHSLAAVGLAGAIERAFARPLPPAELFQHRTVERLAALLGSPRRERGRSLVAIQPSGSRRPLFVAHPVTGNVLCYADLARHLGRDQPLYGLQSPAFDGGAPLPTVEAMADHYVSSLRAVQPRGPYLLAGWSVGGTIAFAMAHQLVRSGEEVALLALIEAWAPGEKMKEATRNLDEATISFMFVKNLGRCRGRDLPITPQHFAGLTPEQTIELSLEQLRALDPSATGEGDPEVGRAQLRLLREVFGRTLRAYLAYPLAPYPGRVALLQVSEAAPGHPRPPTLGWDELARERVERPLLPGNHFTMVYEPHVAALAASLRALLDEAQR